MHKPTYEEFKKEYLKAESRLLDLLLEQIQACEPCKVVDYAYCLKRCRVLRDTLSKAKEHSDFFWIAKRVLYQILQFVKAETYCKANGIEVDYSKEFSVPRLEELPPEDKPVINELHNLFKKECQTCNLQIGQSCFECSKVRELQKKLKTHLGRKIFTFFLTLHAGFKREEKSREREIRFFYERIYKPPVKVNWTPKDPWGFFFWKVLKSQRSPEE
ncbi:hypothetical protein [Desulfurobacterium crinifex]